MRGTGRDGAYVDSTVPYRQERAIDQSVDLSVSHVVCTTYRLREVVVRIRFGVKDRDQRYDAVTKQRGGL